jgi:hypothetical protein
MNGVNVNMNSVPEAKIICDSISPEGKRLVTMEVKIHRFVLAELNTHRVFSRNSASSRAIPVKKLLERVKTDPAMPVFWGKNQAGMGATVELDTVPKTVAIGQWLLARDQAIQTVNMLSDLGLHKQLTNRLLEPWLWHTAIISSTEWTNFFGQRCSLNPETGQPYAQPEMHAAAMAMQKAFYESTPNPVGYGDWHLPYIQEEDREWVNKYFGVGMYLPEKDEIKSHLKKISSGRCARVSYRTHDGKRDPLEDIKLADKLMSATPMHGSPFEHVATPWDFFMNRRGNFRGWQQYRHSFNNETVKEFTPNYNKE